MVLSADGTESLSQRKIIFRQLTQVKGGGRKQPRNCTKTQRLLAHYSVGVHKQ
jgi:hypothetical protein